MTEFRADLHCHTLCSDGSDTPLELLSKAKEVGLTGLSITDHDTIAAYTPELFIQAAEMGIQLLTGIELSSEWKDSTVHVLGYNIDIHSAPFITFLAELIKRRDTRNEAMIEKLKKKGFAIEAVELADFGNGTIGRPHIAQLLMQKGYVSSIQEAFYRFIGEGCPCFSAGIKYTPAEVVAEIHKAGGMAVLAHPHFVKKVKILDYLLQLPLDGLECYYSVLRPHQEKPWIDLAKKRSWIATGGSDYHGSIKPHIQLGCSWVGQDIFQLLQTGEVKLLNQPQ